MPETRRQFTAEFRERAVRIVRETGRPIAQASLRMAAAVRGGSISGVIFHTDRAANTRPGCSPRPAAPSA